METKKNTGKIIEIMIRTVIVAVSLVMIYWYLDSHFIAFGSIAGIIIFSVIALASLGFGFIKKAAQKLMKRKGGKTVIYVFLTFIVLFVIYSGTVLGLMIGGSHKEPSENATVVVLGCQVRGTEPSKTLKIRLDTAYDYLSAHTGAKAVLSGGKGDDEDISEAQCMYNYLTAKGISPERLIKEDRSSTTDENIMFTKELIDKNGLNSEIAIVTDWYHEFRASIIAKRHGINAGAISAPTAPNLTANLVTREIFAIAHEVIFH